METSNISKIQINKYTAFELVESFEYMNIILIRNVPDSMCITTFELFENFKTF